jgi:hypothetical protein
MPWYYPETRPQRLPLTTPVRPAASGGGGGPPTGLAGGDLAGSYPNPTLAPGAVGTTDIVDGAVTDAKVTSVAYSKVTGAPAIPTTLPPSGPASGDLTGTYPAPTVGAAKVTRAKIAPDAWLSPIPVDPANVGQVLTVAAGPALAWQPPAAVQGVTAVWNYRTVDGTGDPGARNLSPDVAAAPTFLRFSTTDTAGSDVRNVLVTTGVGDVLIAQQRTDSSKWSKIQVRAPVVDHATWFEVPITLLANSGAGVPANNTDVAVQFQRGTGSTSAPPSGPAGGDLGAPGSTYPNPTIAAGAVTDAKIVGMAYTKLTGAPTSLPPSGTAGGDLVGSTYPNPVVAAGAITAAKIAAGVIPTTLPPSGAAGGDLAGSSYPNPVIAAGAVTNAKIADVAYAKVTGAPTTLPPSGAATGSLAGSYPAPSIAASAVRGTPSAGGTAREIAKASIWGADDLIDASVSDAKIAAVAYAKVTGAPTSLPPSGAASGSLAGTYPGPTLTTTGVAAGTYGSAAKIPRVTLTTEGRVSAVTELDVAPTGGSPSGPAGGSLAGSYPNPTLATSGVTAGTYGSQYKVAQITVNAEGRVTAVAEITVRARWG